MILSSREVGPEKGEMSRKIGPFYLKTYVCIVFPFLLCQENMERKAYLSIPRFEY